MLPVRRAARIAVSSGITRTSMPSIDGPSPHHAGFADSVDSWFGRQSTSRNGPDPIAWVPMVPASISVAGAIAAFRSVMAVSTGTSWRDRWNTTVRASGVSMRSIDRKFARVAAPVASSRMRWNDACTSADVTG